MDGETRERVCLGVIIGAQGVRGEVRIKAFAERPDDLGAYGPLETEDGAASYLVERLRPAKGVVIARLAGIADRNAAEALKGTRLYVGRDALPEPEEEEWYHADLIGLAVETVDGRRLGTVAAIHDFGAGDLVEVACEDGGPTEMIPFTREQVPVVDVAAGRLVVVPLEEMEEADDTEDRP